LKPSWITTNPAAGRSLPLPCCSTPGSDVVRMGRKHVRGNVLWISQQKTGQDVHVPLHSEFRAILDSLPRDNLTFLMTAQGRPFTPPGFTNWFRAMGKGSGLPDGLSPHGLRKATCRRLAEAGCTPHQIMAISGHRSLAEVTRHIVAAGRKDLAAQAMLALEPKEVTQSAVKPATMV